MYKIITAPISREKTFVGEDIVRTRGFMVAIEPPVDLVPEVVTRALLEGTLGDARLASRAESFAQISLIGSTEDRTVIYARLMDETNDQDALFESQHRLRERTRELLGVLGINGVEYDSESQPLSKLV